MPTVFIGSTILKVLEVKEGLLFLISFIISLIYTSSFLEYTIAYYSKS